MPAPAPSPASGRGPHEPGRGSYPGGAVMRRFAPIVSFALLGATIVASASRLRPSPTSEDDAVQTGRRIFEQRCALCHTTGERAAQGPGLGGVLGRKAASMPFGYSRALHEAGLTWDRATLDRFLASPG